MSILLWLSSAWAVENGEIAPDFTLKSTGGQEYQLSSFRGKVVVLEWFNPGCPFVRYAHEQQLTHTLAKENPDVVWLAVNSSAPKKQGHGLETNLKAQKKWNISYPILLDEQSVVGRMYGAKTTPHMYIIDQSGTLVYQGALDNAPFGRGKEHISYVGEALKQIAKGEKPKVAKTKAYGCSVKYP